MAFEMAAPMAVLPLTAAVHGQVGDRQKSARIGLSRLPDQAARQLPDLSTTIRVEPSSTGDPRLRGALPEADIRRSRIQIRTH